MREMLNWCLVVFVQKSTHHLGGKEKRHLLFSAWCSSCQAHVDFLFLALPAELWRRDPTLAAGQGIQLCLYSLSSLSCPASWGWIKAAAHSAFRGQGEFGRALLMAVFILWYNLTPMIVCWKLTACILSVHKTDLKAEDRLELILC